MSEYHPCTVDPEAARFRSGALSRLAKDSKDAAPRDFLFFGYVFIHAPFFSS